MNDSFAERLILSDDRVLILDAIRESSARGVPAIAFSITSPPEAGPVTGYEKGGDRRQPER